MILGPPVGYTDILDFEIEEHIKKEREQKRNPMRPSGAGYCARRLAYDLAEYRGFANYNAFEDRTPATHRLLELGNSVEFAALKAFRMCKVIQQKYKQQILTFREIDRGDPSLPKELLEGSCDFCFIHPEWKAIGDVKSKKDSFSQTFKTGWDEELDWLSRLASVERFSETAFWVEDLPAFIAELGDDFLVDNLIQLNLYARSPFILQHGIDHAFLYRYNKNDSRHMEIRFKPSAEVYEATLAKFDAISVAVDTVGPDEVPRGFPLGSARCAFCPHKGHCWPDDDALRTHFKTLPAKNWPQDLHKLPLEIRGSLYNKFNEYELAIGRVGDVAKLENELTEMLNRENIRRIRLDNGNIYDVKYNKTPRPHFKLKRSKL